MRARLRVATGAIIWGLCGLALAVIVGVAALIVVDVALKGIPAWSWTLLTTTTSGIAGGLLNSWTGTLALMLLLAIMAGPIGILAGLYLAEFSSRRTGPTLRFATEVLSGIPSIVVGYVIYLAFVVGLGWSFSYLAGGIALTVMVVPYIIKSTEAALNQVPSALREGGAALGLSPRRVLWDVARPIATPGIVTGVVIAEAIGMGETAPLLYTAGWSNALPTAQLTHRPIGYLTYVVWTYINEPYAQAHQLAYSAAGLLIVLLLVLIAVGRVISHRAARYSGRFQT
ncbi:MAG TPA: phosphate ABC transporter permease PstA [Thermomicrobiaceae bacterium]|nr:phosphate ABC transporter permease PstA [Thermomicrobiaceae bacterium]